MKNKALIFNIQRYSLHDGPGIRTLVFFKGCPLRCIWCSNPEGIDVAKEVSYIKQRCNGCGRCIKSCPNDAIKLSSLKGYYIERDKCNRCGICIDVCYTKAKEWSGHEIGLGELMEKIRKDKSYYESSGGGVTLGGGDPLMQSEFVEKLLLKCREENINTAIETEANCSYKVYKKCAVLCDTVFTDLKAFDDNKHKCLTGVSNLRIIDNITKFGKYLEESGNNLDYIIRIPLLPDINYNLEDIKKAGSFLKTIKPLRYIEILPFHNLGENKYEQLSLDYKLKGKDSLRDTDVKEYADVLRNEGLTVKVTNW